MLRRAVQSEPVLNPSFHDELVGDWHLLVVQGEIDMATAPKLRQQIIALVGQGSTKIIIDLEGVEFIDSTGLGVLVGAVKRVRTLDGALRVVCQRANLVELFELTKLTNVFSVFDTVDLAVSAPTEP